MRGEVSAVGLAASCGAAAALGYGIGRWALPPVVCALLRRARARATCASFEDFWPELEGGPDPWGRQDGLPRDRRLQVAAFAAAWFAALVLLGLSASEAVLLGLCGLALVAAAACDVEAGLIPWETCAALAAAGLALQACSFGLEGVAFGALSSAAVAVFCLVADVALERREMAGVGGGDVRCMAALSLASGRFALMGLAVCCLAMVASGALLAALKRKGLGEPRPMAPFFLLWLASLAAACALV